MTHKSPDASAAPPAAAEEAIPLAQEELRIEKREVTTARVRVRTVTETEHELAWATLEEETVEVTRVPIGRMVDEPPGVRTENGVTIVPIFEEVLVVEKRLLLKEELHIRKHTTTEQVEVPVDLRKQRAIVERDDLDTTAPTEPK